MLVWISGASAGIGAALVATVPFEAEIVDISRRGGTPGTYHVAADLADPDSWPLVAEDFAKRVTRFEGERVALIHCAATLTPLGPADAVDTTAYTRNVLLNAAAAQVLGHSFLQATAELRCERHLVMLSSGAARHPYEGESSYCAAKAAIDQWVRTVGLEQRRRGSGCRVIAIAPGAVDTAMQDEIRHSDDATFPDVERFRALKASGDLCPPEDVARSIWSLLDRDLENGTVAHLRDLI
jgi:NADP-dependent 3-hydroxy acid dehydrogenase YdfG